MPTEVRINCNDFLVLFQALFNILYEERINCQLKQSALASDRELNWNRINATICFNYLQQQFYLVTPTMKTLAKGSNNTAILKLLRILIQSTQGNYGDQYLDDEVVREIAEGVIEHDAFKGGDEDEETQKQMPRTGAIVMGNPKFSHLENFNDEEESKE